MSENNENALKNKINDIVNKNNQPGTCGQQKTAKEKNRDARNNSYEASYTAIRNWCDAQQGKWTAESCLVLANIIFGWMPTAILFRSDSVDCAEGAPDKIIEKMAEKIAEMINVNDFTSDREGDSIDTLKSFLKNSYVGASKFLHFIYPHHFAMWDSNVASALKKLNTGKKDDFTLYQKAMRSFVKDNPNYTLRDVELLIFKAGQSDGGGKI